MHIGRSVSLRGFLAATFALAVLAGGACTLLVASRDEAAVALTGQNEVRRLAGLIADRLDEGLATVGRDAGLAAEAVVFAREGNQAAVRPLLERWRAMHPGYANVLVADRSGRVLATASGSFAGADVSGSTWFSRGLSGAVIGDASDRSRADADVPRNVIVATPLRAGGGAEIGVLAVQLAPDWIDVAVAAARRSLGGAARDAVVQIANSGGRALHRSAGPARDGAVHEAAAPVGEGTGLGWLVSVKGRSQIADASGIGLAPLLALAAAALAAALVGGAFGGRLARDIARIRNAAHEDRADPACDRAATADLAALAESVGACVGRSQGRERLLKETRTALVRSRDRVRAVRLLGGFTCWEVDLRNGQVTWANGSAVTAGSASEQACDLEQVLARIEVDGRDLLKDAMRAVCEEPGAVREAVVRTLAGPEDAAGRRLVLRLTAVALDGQPVRLHILSRELAFAALPAPATPPVEAGEAATAPERPAGFPAQAIVAGIAQDVGGALDAVVAALEGVEAEDGAARDDRIEAALRGAARGGALLRRVAALVRPEDTAIVHEADAAGIVADTAAFIRAAILPGLVLTPPEGGLPWPACGARQVEVALLNLASDARASLPADAAVSLAAGRGTTPSNASGLRFELVTPQGFHGGGGLAAVRDLMDGIDGSVTVATGGGGVTLTLVFPAAVQDPARPASGGSADEGRAVLLVEPDAVLRAGAAESLTGRGYAVATAASAEEAGEILAGRRDFAVLLCAHALPALDGVHLAEVVSRTHPAIGIVLMAPETVRPQGGAVFRTLRKPFGSQDLADACAAAAVPQRRADAA